MCIPKRTTDPEGDTRTIPMGKVCIFTKQNLRYFLYSITSDYTQENTLLKDKFAAQCIGRNTLLKYKKVAVQVDTHF